MGLYRPLRPQQKQRGEYMVNHDIINFAYSKIIEELHALLVLKNAEIRVFYFALPQNDYSIAFIRTTNIRPLAPAKIISTCV